jgi:hypothetical protein
MRIRPHTTDQRTRYGTVILSDGTLDYSFTGEIRLNRSKRWTYAKTYLQARELSPSARPVR